MVYCCGGMDCSADSIQPGVEVEYPISNLVASEQVRNGDWVRVDFDSGQNNMRFLQEAQGMSLHRVAERIEASTPAPLRAPTAALSSEASPSRTPSAPLGEVNFGE